MPSNLPVLVVACALALAGSAYAQSAPDAEPASSTVGSTPWNALNAEQRNALRPLASLWPTLRSEHQRKWLALAYNFDRMSPDEQATLQSRMAEWAKLTPAQRTQARLNFGEVRRAVPADERRAKWEEYQALPAEERERLANDRPKPPVTAAPALRPVPTDRIVRPPTAVLTNGTSLQPAPDAARPAAPLNRNTLLPQPPGVEPRTEH